MNKPTSIDLAMLPASKLVAGFANGTISPVAAAEAALDRIVLLNETLNAYCLVDGGAALQAARKSEARWHKAAPLGPLDGVLVAVKDLLLTEGTAQQACNGALDVRDGNTIEVTYNDDNGNVEVRVSAARVGCTVDVLPGTAFLVQGGRDGSVQILGGCERRRCAEFTESLEERHNAGLPDDLQSPLSDSRNP